MRDSLAMGAGHRRWLLMAGSVVVLHGCVQLLGDDFSITDGDGGGAGSPASSSSVGSGGAGASGTGGSGGAGGQAGGMGGAGGSGGAGCKTCNDQYNDALAGMQVGIVDTCPSALIPLNNLLTCFCMPCALPCTDMCDGDGMGTVDALCAACLQTNLSACDAELNDCLAN